MRFNVELLLDNDTIPKEKNKMILSLMKHNFSNYDKNYFEDLYKVTLNKQKSFTFALYMGSCKFLREEIIIPEKKIIMNFSTSNVKDGIMFYNSFLKHRGLKYPIKNNFLKINRINLNHEKTITGNEAIFKTLSPISVREHFGDNKQTWYHSLNEEAGQEIFLNNLKYQLKNEYGEDKALDIKEVQFEVIANKEVKIKNYDIEVLGNICRVKIYAKSYILDYLYKAGIGSQRSTGFGMVDLV